MMLSHLLLERVISVVYLCKQDRQAAILQAAARIALNEGLAATTVRRVACEAHTASGQVHHHFSSAASLRADAYGLVMRELQWELEAGSCHLTALERLQLYLIDAKDDKYVRSIRLWREAMLLSEQDELMKAAFARSLYDWHRLVKHVVECGRKTREFSAGDDADDIAWRLIGLASSFDGMSRLEPLALTPDRVAHNLNRAIEKELLIAASH